MKMAYLAFSIGVFLATGCGQSSQTTPNEKNKTTNATAVESPVNTLNRLLQKGMPLRDICGAIDLSHFEVSGGTTHWRVIRARCRIVPNHSVFMTFRLGPNGYRLGEWQLVPLTKEIEGPINPFDVAWLDAPENPWSDYD